MVRMPEPAPARQVPPKELLEPGTWSQLLDLFRRVNTDYLYWDDFKHKQMPSGIDPRDAWSALKLARGVNRRSTPIADRTGEHYWYTRTDELERVLHVIDQQAGGNVSASVGALSTHEKRRYLISSLMEEAIASSQIEGAVTTRRVAKEMLRTRRPPKDRAEKMILNNYVTISRISDLVDEPLTPELIVSLQESLTRDALDHPEDCGRLRGDEDDIVIAADDATGGQVLHVPPPAGRIRPELLRLCEYANSNEGAFEHPVLKAVVLHFWLAYLHPFADGNGRTARAVFNLFMLKSGYWLFEYLSISRVILDRRAKYYRSFLYSEIDDADLTYFVTFNLHAIEKALTELWAYLERKSKDDAAIRAKVERDSALNYRQRAILIRALREPDTEFTIDSHRVSHNVSYGTSRNDLLGLQSLGYLALHKRGKEYVFRTSGAIADLLGDG
jgi:Fic family protein